MKIPRKIAEFFCKIINELDNEKQEEYANEWNKLIDDKEYIENHIPRIN